MLIAYQYHKNVSLYLNANINLVYVSPYNFNYYTSIPIQFNL